jgi:hypothetical protein
MHIVDLVISTLFARLSKFVVPAPILKILLELLKVSGADSGGAATGAWCPALLMLPMSSSVKP